MKKKLLGTLLFSVALSSLAYAEADADRISERREQREKEQQGIIENSNSIENSNENVGGTITTNLSPEDEREAYAALERARVRIEKEEKEKLKAQQEIEEAQKQSEGQSEIATEQTTDGTSNQNQVFVEVAAPRMTAEEEKEAYEALERVRARILKEDEERAELLKAAAEQQVQ